ncbi:MULTISPECIES: polymer-forming cytoskeletal protein [Thalassospira]|jgi:cytoskeletal protein CcmA (bactofilin family)|uniref:Integral membrane protein CcmA involved in cell shape determination n=1 Tax=Thalassospira profundimaris TaxID=502049 RepID=A0A367V5L6_9PROT|nr:MULTISPECIES: polymer-forming cytoskeletal protein [Thalassospira]KZB72820.1 cell shape determination protein CcmA [Thalassospira sp. MCCC 1A01148]MBC44843.1 cell shape determination protein CcmA [Thalassospira sp.]MBO6807124.1 polymer-forming cytoskeletal protein [Thalassospira sp.]MBO6841822.1 polymer-forming cytoskeletal protein [Thalassospira sp.]MBS8272906.1 polymer-forming cytoskeletal protein [Thalassospira tepidiphila]|tara:strand:- start:2362 stop:2817 length:456 start_codon:yes stop_codon:yes gene_type:complete
MFSKASKTTQTTSKNGSNSTAEKKGGLSVINADLRVTGDLISESDVQVDGSVNGDIRTRTLTIGQNGEVRGEIVADKIRICGSVVGQVRAKDVSLSDTARMIGDILHESLSIEPGAHIEGHCRRIESAEEGGLTVIQAGQVVAANVKKENK